MVSDIQVPYPASVEAVVPSLNDLWTCRTQAPSCLRFNSWSLLRTHLKAYIERGQAENHARDLSGWRKQRPVIHADTTSHVEIGSLGNARRRMKQRVVERCWTIVEDRIRQEVPRMRLASATVGTLSQEFDKPCHVRKKPIKSRGSKRPAAGTAEARRQTAAACEQNMRRLALKRQQFVRAQEAENGGSVASNLSVSCDTEHRFIYNSTRVDSGAHESECMCIEETQCEEHDENR
jgi:hypothetical protein